MATGMVALAAAGLWSDPASAQCVPGVFTGADETCSGTFVEINQGGLTNHQRVTFQGVTVTNTGVFIDAANDSDLTLVFDPTVAGGAIAHASGSGITLSGNGGDLVLNALAPAGGTAAHSIDAFRTGVNANTRDDGTIEVDSALEIANSLVGYELETDAGSISATVRAPITAASAGIVARSETGDITIDVHHTAPDGQPDILFSNDGTRANEAAAGILVDRRGPRGGDDPTSTITVNVHDDVSIVGPFDASYTSVDSHSGIMVRPANARIGVFLGDNVFIDPVDYGSFAASSTSGVLTRLGARNTINVNDLDEDGLAIGIHARSGAVDNSTPFDTTYPHAVAVVTGGANQINVTGNVVDVSKGEPQPVAGIAAIATPSESGGGENFAAAKGEDGPLKSSILVSLGAHDAGGGVMAGDQITVIGDGLTVENQSIYGVLALHNGEGPEDGPAITIRSDDASAEAPTHILVGDDDEASEDVTGDRSYGISAQNAGSADTQIDLGAYTFITVVDNDDPLGADPASDPGIGTRASEDTLRTANSVGVHVVAGSRDAKRAGGDISIGIGEYNQIDVTGGYGITALYQIVKVDPEEAPEARVTVGANALVRSDYSAVVIGGSPFGSSSGSDRPGEAHLYNHGNLVSATKLRNPAQPDEVTPILDLRAMSLVEVINDGDGYVGNAVDPSLADPSALAVYAQIEPTTAERVNREGEILFENYGSMVGRVWFLDTPDANEAVTATLNNMGYWNFVGDVAFEVDGTRTINNGGVIHTVDIAGGSSEAGLGTFAGQISELNNFAWDDGSGVYLPGIVSMLDGEANDETTVLGVYDGGDYTAGYNGTIAVDAILDVHGVGAADFFEGRYAYRGSSAVFVDNVNPGFGGRNEFGIPLVSLRAGLENGCGTFCKAGDGVYLSPESPDYAWLDDGEGGLGIIRDGLNAWALVPEFFVPERDGYLPGASLVTVDYSPDRRLMPSLITAAQNIWYDTDSIVQDQLAMLNSAAGPGGGGADLAAGYDFIDAGASTATPNNGLWLRASGEWTEQDSQVSDGVFTFDTSFDQDTYSILAGADMKFDPDSPFRLGLFGGYVTSDVTFTGYDIDSDYEGGTFGAYAAYVAGGFTADATVKADLVEAAYESTAGDVDADVVNIGVRANTGYRFDGGLGFVEPIASFAYVHSEIDDMDFGPSTVDFSNGDSLRAGLGARFGTAFGGPAGSTTELSLLAKLWNEFEDENTVTITGPGGTESYTDSISGLFGEVVAIAAMTAADGMTSGFLSAGAEFNDDFTSYSGKVGVRRAW